MALKDFQSANIHVQLASDFRTALRSAMEDPKQGAVSILADACLWTLLCICMCSLYIIWARLLGASGPLRPCLTSTSKTFIHNCSFCDWHSACFHGYKHGTQLSIFRVVTSAMPKPREVHGCCGFFWPFFFSFWGNSHRFPLFLRHWPPTHKRHFKRIHGTSLSYMKRDL
jgi:hypothetical protein